MKGRQCCTSCKKPIMIISSLPESKKGTTQVEQVTKKGCLNKNCDKYKVVVATERVQY